MITPQRHFDLRDSWLDETSGLLTREWRDELTKEEAALVAWWDGSIRRLRENELYAGPC